jgi:hypothetical protein
LAHALMYGRCTISGVGSYTGLGITKLPMQSAHALVYDRCTIGRVGSYIEFGITKSPMHSAHALVYGRCTIGGVGSYIGLGITKSSMHLAHALVYGRCTIGRVGSYIGCGITKSSLQLAQQTLSCSKHIWKPTSSLPRTTAPCCNPKKFLLGQIELSQCLSQILLICRNHFVTQQHKVSNPVTKLCNPASNGL